MKLTPSQELHILNQVQSQIWNQQVALLNIEAPRQNIADALDALQNAKMIIGMEVERIKKHLKESKKNEV